MIPYTSPRGERLGLVPCREDSGRVVVEVWELIPMLVGRWDFGKELGLSDLGGVDVDPDGEREEIEPTDKIMAALRMWEGKVEEL